MPERPLRWIWIVMCLVSMPACRASFGVPPLVRAANGKANAHYATQRISQPMLSDMHECQWVIYRSKRAMERSQTYSDVMSLLGTSVA